MSPPIEFPIDYQPRLVEGAVLVAVREREEEEEFWQRRDRIYETSDPEGREAQFLAFNTIWFERLELDRPVREALMEQPLIVENARSCVVSSARSRKDEGADLYVSPPHIGGRSVGICLGPERFADPGRLLQFLRHELLHVADMLDPCFNYSPHLPLSSAGPTHEQLLKHRYRALWNAYVDGRLARCGLGRIEARAERFTEFASTFPMLGEETSEAFERFFEGSGLTHDELVSFAANPEQALGREREGPYPGERCSLCGFPTHAFESEPLSPALQRRIRESFPEWDPVDGLCSQCAEIYRSRLPEGVR